MELELDLKSLWNIFANHFKPILLVTLVVTVCAFLYSAYLIPKQYVSTALLYVENKQNTTDTVNINDISAAQKLVTTCQILFTSSTVLQDVSDELHLEYTVGELKKMVTVQSVNSTEVMKIETMSNDPVEAAEITNKLVELSREEFNRVIRSGSIEIVEYANPDYKPAAPSVRNYTLIGFMAGLILMYGIFFLIEILDVRVKPDDDLYDLYKIPVFAEILDFEAVAKGEVKYGK